jgi:hypothetical protein
MSEESVRARRRFIAGLGAAPVAGFANAAIADSEREVPASSAVDRKAESSEYLLSPGLIHLNTASLGATPRAVFDRVIQAWRELESDPVRMAYFTTEDTVLSATEKVRERAAGFLGCDPDELLLTRCTTDGMNNVAQSIRWNAGDRVLTTDQEHHGGSLGWLYQTQRRGVLLDRILDLDGGDSQGQRAPGGSGCLRCHGHGSGETRWSDRSRVWKVTCAIESFTMA